MGLQENYCYCEYLPVTFIHSATVGGSCSVPGADLSPGSKEGWRGSWVGGWVGGYWASGSQLYWVESHPTKIFKVQY